MGLTDLRDRLYERACAIETTALIELFLIWSIIATLLLHVMGTGVGEILLFLAVGLGGVLLYMLGRGIRVQCPAG